ncbi:Cold-shock DEAD box protein A-like protein [Mycobacteroides abscessus subsp. abscessus]|nr:Cold-shock DEAD box protein A-like protein [Mycobacteroides abscessus subsp. abscessus]
MLEVEPFEAMIIFVRTKQGTEELAEKLRARGFSAAAINGDIAQNQRERTIGQLKSGALDILVATDVAARGLDVDRISQAGRRCCSSPRASGICSRPSSAPPGIRSRRCSCPAWRT